MTPFLISQILAAVAFICGVVSFQYKNRRAILFWMCGSATMSACHFFVLDRPAPAVLYLIMGTRSIVAAFTVNRKWMYFFFGLIIFGFYLSYKNPLGFLALFLTLLATYGTFQKTDKKVRLIYMICAASWVVHNFLVGSPVATVMEATFLTSNLVAYRRFYLSGSRK